MRLVHAIAAALALGSLWPFPTLGQAERPGAPPPAVTVATIGTQDVAPRYQYIGHVEAIQFVDLRARVQGYLQSVTFHEGQQVNQGDVLYVIEPDIYEAAVTRARANLQSAEATLKEAAVNLTRIRELAAHGNAPRAQLDDAIAKNDTAAAAVLSAQADLRTAEINLGYTRIAAPIAGRIGKTAFTVGNLVDSTSGVLARIVQLDPIRVVFSVSERDFISTVAEESGATLQQLGAQFVPTLQLANGAAYPGPGRMDFADNQVDPNTGTIALRALFDNRESILLPGETVEVTVQRVPAKVMPVVPISAVEESKDGKFVLLIGQGNKIEQRPIKAELQVGQNWAVENGLKGGETIVVDGLQKAQPGMVVTPVRSSTVVADK
jgi:membrane fusion protein (multidrug efflux system)